MGVFAGPANAWSNFTNQNRLDASTKVLVQSGLVLNLDAGVSSSYPGSGATWTDLSGRGNNGTLVNGVGFDGGNGGSLSFDGVNDHINLNNRDDLTLNTFSYSCWFYPTAYYNLGGIDGNTIFSRENARHYFQFQNNGQYKIFLRGNLFSTNGQFEENIGNTNIIQVNTSWYNVVVNVDWSTSSFSVYHNGLLIWNYTNTLLGNSFINTTVRDATIGSRYNGLFVSGSSRFIGKISNFTFYNRVLTAQEIQQNFNALRGRFGI